MSQATDLQRLLSWLKSENFKYREFAEAKDVSDAVASWPLLHEVAAATGQPVTGAAPEGDAAAKQRIARNQTMMPSPPVLGDQIQEPAAGHDAAVPASEIESERLGASLRQRLALARSARASRLDSESLPAPPPETTRTPFGTAAADRGPGPSHFSREALERARDRAPATWGERADEEFAGVGRRAQQAVEPVRGHLGETIPQTPVPEPAIPPPAGSQRRFSAEEFRRPPPPREPSPAAAPASFLGGAYHPSDRPERDTSAAGEDRGDKSLRAVFTRVAGVRDQQGRTDEVDGLSGRFR